MISVISRSDLKDFQRYKTFSEARNAHPSAQQGRWTKKPTVFLSHSHLDESLVLSAIALIERFGGEVYVDWMDAGMPEKTNAVTAKILREKMQAASRFVVLASPRALESRWVPWELGYADATRGLQQVAVLPVRDDHSDYPGCEYLQIYPAITMAPHGKPVVTFPGEKLGAELGYWLGEHWGKVIYGTPMPIRLNE
jgi:hypothetical protein